MSMAQLAMRALQFAWQGFIASSRKGQLCVMQAAEKQAIADKTKGDVVLALVPLVDSFEAARNSLKAETEGERKLESAYQAGRSFLSVWAGSNECTVGSG